jgi:glycine/D-amino acid oxidase-like deaminating enzyme
MIAPATNPVSERWYGIYALHRDRPLFSTTINGAIRVITGIGGKGMTTGPALARESIDAIAAG